MGSQKDIDFNHILFHKKNRKKIVLAVVILLLIIAAGFIYNNYQTTGGTENKDLITSVPSSIVTTTVFGIKTACDEFPKISDEISCEEAADIVLNGYKEKIIVLENSLTDIDLTGKIYHIDRQSIKLLTENETIKKDVWVVKIELEKPISLSGIEKVDSIEFCVDRSNGVLIITAYGSGKL